MAIADPDALVSPASSRREVALPEVLPAIDFGNPWPTPPNGAPVCRICGCWDRRACYQPDRGACAWVERDLCSHCVPRLKARRWRRRFFILLIGVVAFWSACAVVAWRDAQSDDPGPPTASAQGV